MKCTYGLIGVVITLSCAAEAHAQVIFFPLSVNVGPWGFNRGPGFVYQRRGVLVLGPLTGRVTIRTYEPRRVVVAPVDNEVAGVDLDLVRPAKTEASRPERVPVGPEAPLPGVDVSVPRRPVRPGDAGPERKAEPPAKRPAPKAPEPPREEPRDESGRLLQLGRAAFGGGEYGLAAQHFQQAAAADALAPTPQFMLAQALFALGKYRQAVAAIHTGMALMPGWPEAPFRPRRDLYLGKEDELDAHLQRLEKVVTEQPNNATFLFLLGYELWFDGRRAEALPWFQRARANAADPIYLDPFLKAPPPGPVAVK